MIDHSDNSSAISTIIFSPNNPSYDEILNFYIRNLLFGTPKTPKPKLILTPTDESQIQTAIFCSKKTGLQMRIRSGGNDFEGGSYVSHVPFFILDMFKFRSISIDAPKKTAWVGAGVTLGELYFAINKTDSALAFPAGYWPSVCVGGHISSGGFGPLFRKHGLSADNVVDAIVIDANGKVLDRKSMGEDLFWAIRGGVGASFGVIIAYKLKLVDVPPKVAAFTVTRTREQDATALVYQWQHVAPKVPVELVISMQLGSVLVSETGRETIQATFVAVFLGEVDVLILLMGKYFPELGVTKKDCATMSWPEYNLYHFGFPLENVTQMLLSRSPPAPVSYFKIKPDFVQNPIPKKGLEEIWELILKAPLGEAQMEWTPMGGKMDEIPETAIPFPHRIGNIVLIEERIAWSKSNTAITKKYLAFSRKLYELMGQFVENNPRRAYANYRDLDLGVNNINGPVSIEHSRIWGAPYFRGNFDRLVRVKTRVDPTNFFNYEQSIPLFSPHACRNSGKENWRREK